MVHAHVLAGLPCRLTAGNPAITEPREQAQSHMVRVDLGPG